MARPPAKQLTERELEVMHAVWDCSPPGYGQTAADGPTVNDVRDRMAVSGRDLAPSTVATLMKILAHKRYLVRTTDRRPHRYAATRGFAEVSGTLVGELVKKVFGGSREALLARLVDERLTPSERDLLRSVLDGGAENDGSDDDEPGAGDE